jgi:hypothetical protein
MDADRLIQTGSAYRSASDGDGLLLVLRARIRIRMGAFAIAIGHRITMIQLILAAASLIGPGDAANCQLDWGVGSPRSQRGGPASGPGWGILT